MRPRKSALARSLFLIALILPLTKTTTGQDSPPLSSKRPAEKIAQTIDIEKVWAGHVVRFSLLTAPPWQYVAYYDAERRMSIARRKLDEEKWTFKKLPTSVGWDSHNSVTMALDSTNILHVSGNMHCVPLIYFRAEKPFDIASLKKIDHMVDPKYEQRATYPVFFQDAQGQLVFRYRDGGSGRGNDHYNRYDTRTRTWSPLLDGPLMSGLGEVNGYFTRPTKGPDGWFHIVGVWRDTPDAATNHDLSYARSRDLAVWETGAGKQIKLPLTMNNMDIVDPVPAGGGMINSNIGFGFDSKGRPVITYHKYTADGSLEIFLARLEQDKWNIVQPSDWGDYRWDFGGNGSLVSEVSIGSVRPVGDGLLALRYRYPKDSGVWAIDEKTLKAQGPLPERYITPRLPPELSEVESDFPGMGLRHAGDSGVAPEPGVRYMLTWETLGRNRDRAREKPWPEPSMLRVHRLFPADR